MVKNYYSDKTIVACVFTVPNIISEVVLHNLFIKNVHHI